jgi:hypothetical protein
MDRQWWIIQKEKKIARNIEREISREGMSF